MVGAIPLGSGFYYEIPHDFFCCRSIEDVIFPLATFQVFSQTLFFRSLSRICLDVVFFVCILLGVHEIHGPMN